jgi:hypothetical protein
VRRIFITIFSLFVPVAPFALSQADSRAVRVTITSNVPDARILIDSLDAGVTPLRDFTLPEGRHVICVISGGTRRWFAEAVCETVDVTDGLQLHMRLPRTIAITSEPYGATIIFKDSLLGTTPSLIPIHDEAGMVRLTKEGYDDATLFFDASIGSLHAVLKQKDIQSGNNRWMYLEKEESGAIVPVVVSASSAVLSGAMAAYWKLRADDVYREYRRTGDPAQLDRIHKLDLVSGIALGLSQASLAFLTYLLVSQ